MEIGQLLEMIKTPLTEKDLIRVSDLSDKELRNFEIKLHTPNREGMLQIAKSIEKDICNLYIVEKGMHHLVYWDKTVFVEIMSYDNTYIKQFKIKEMIEHQYKQIERLKEDGKGLSFLLYTCNSNAKYLIFKYIYENIADNEKYELFKNLYINSEYGFQMFTSEFIEDAMKYKKPISLKKMVRNFSNVVDGKIIVYRGMSSKSTPADKAWSWTTDFNTALFFATRYGISGSVIQGTVLIEDIIDYINDRNEHEVFINPKNVQNHKEMEFYDFEQIQDELIFNGVIDKYLEYKVNIDEDNYKNPSGIHGVLHARRVLLLALVIAYYENLNEEDTEILAWASIIHDIGRTHEDEDEEHGEESWEKAYELGIIPELNDEDTNLLKYIVETHSQPDGNLMKDDKIKYGFNDEIRALRLYKAFKDADGLDRVRLRDLNTKYLRTSSAQKMVLLANQFLRGIK